MPYTRAETPLRSVPAGEGHVSRMAEDVPWIYPKDSIIQS